MRSFVFFSFLKLYQLRCCPRLTSLSLSSSSLELLFCRTSFLSNFSFSFNNKGWSGNDIWIEVNWGNQRIATEPGVIDNEDATDTTMLFSTRGRTNKDFILFIFFPIKFVFVFFTDRFVFSLLLLLLLPSPFPFSSSTGANGEFFDDTSLTSSKDDVTAPGVCQLTTIVQQLPRLADADIQLKWDQVLFFSLSFSIEMYYLILIVSLC